MASNTGTVIPNNQTFTTGVVSLAQGVLNPANSPQTVWDCGVGMLYAAITTVVTGSPASFTIVLEGTYDGVNWTILATTTNVAGETVYGGGTTPFTNLRARCSAVSGGTNPTVDVFATASQSPLTQTSTTTSGTGTAIRVAPGSTSAFTTLSAATSGIGTVVDFGSAVSTVMFQIVATGTVTAGAVSMQVSLDNSNWFTPPTAVIQNFSAATQANPYTLVTNTGALFDIGTVSAAFRYARGNITTPVTGGATVTVLISGY